MFDTSNVNKKCRFAMKSVFKDIEFFGSYCMNKNYPKMAKTSKIA